MHKFIMKATLLYSYRGEIRSKEYSIMDVIETIRCGKYAKSIEILRDEVRVMSGISSATPVESAAKVPVVQWSMNSDGLGAVARDVPFVDALHGESVEGHQQDVWCHDGADVHG